MKRVTDIIYEVADIFCTQYCKWPGYMKKKYGDDTDEEILEAHDHLLVICKECPLNRL